MQTILKSEVSLTDESQDTNIRIIDSRFGKLEINLDKNIHFPYGLIGFENYKDFCLANYPRNASKSFKILQSFQDEDISLITYISNMEKVSELINRVDIEKCSNLFKIPLSHMAIIFVVSVHNKPDQNGKLVQKFYVNLRAPLVIDTDKNIGIQYVFTHDKYAIQHEL